MGVLEKPEEYKGADHERINFGLDIKKKRNIVHFIKTSKLSRELLKTEEDEEVRSKRLRIDLLLPGVKVSDLPLIKHKYYLPVSSEAIFLFLPNKYKPNILKEQTYHIMPFLQSERDVSVARTFSGSPVRAIDILPVMHNHVQWIHFSPVVTDVEQQPADDVLPPLLSSPSVKGPDFSQSIGPSHRPWTHYRITDKIPWYGSVTFDTWLQDTDEGVNSYVQAPAGLKIWNRFSVHDGVDGVRMEEEVRLLGNTLLMPFILGNFRESHEAMMGSVVEAAAKRSSR